MAFQRQTNAERIVGHTVEWQRAEGLTESAKRALEARLSQLAAEIEKLKRNPPATEGPQGPQGAHGVDGKAGVGIRGSSGAQGPQGDQGPQGEVGLVDLDGGYPDSVYGGVEIIDGGSI